MKHTIKATGFELTPAIADYVEKKIASLDRFEKVVDTARADVEVGKTSRHHKQGDIFRAEINFFNNGEQFYAVAEKEDIYIAIDHAKDEIIREITSEKDKSMRLYRKGAAKVKAMLKGLPWMN